MRLRDSANGPPPHPRGVREFIEENRSPTVRGSLRTADIFVAPLIGGHIRVDLGGDASAAGADPAAVRRPPTKAVAHVRLSTLLMCPFS
jgi:hypothetical protein